MKYTVDEKKIAREIGYFVYEKHNHNAESSLRELYSYGITNIAFQDGELVIVLAHPGMLIGRKGENIEALQKKLKLKIRIEENTLNDYLTAFNRRDLGELICGEFEDANESKESLNKMKFISKTKV